MVVDGGAGHLHTLFTTLEAHIHCITVHLFVKIPCPLHVASLNPSKCTTEIIAYP